MCINGGNVNRDLAGAIVALNNFMGHWCVNSEESERQGKMVYRCYGCAFENGSTCKVKQFMSKKAPLCMSVEYQTENGIYRTTCMETGRACEFGICDECDGK